MLTSMLWLLLRMLQCRLILSRMVGRVAPIAICTVMAAAGRREAWQADRLLLMLIAAATLPPPQQ